MLVDGRNSPHNLPHRTQFSKRTYVYLAVPAVPLSHCKRYHSQIHTVEVTGSNPVAPTIFSCTYIQESSGAYARSHALSASLLGCVWTHSPTHHYFPYARR